MSRTLKNMPHVVVTRTKSALDKRQLRNREGSRKRINELVQLLKSPTKNRMVGKVAVSPRSPRNTLKKQIVKKKRYRSMKVLNKEDKLSKVINIELEPRIKRNVLENKVFLKPKRFLKEIRSSKRKAVVPQRVASPSPRPQLSLTTLIQLADEDLEPGDLEEILNCPSPVWWEDNDDPWCFEEPLFRLRARKYEKDAPNKEPTAENKDSDPKALIDTIKERHKIGPTDNFKTKKNKLESLLSNLKNKPDCAEVTSEDASENKVRNTRSKSESDDEFAMLREANMLEKLANVEIPIESNDECMIVENKPECFDLTDDHPEAETVKEKADKTPKNLDIINKYEMLLKRKMNKSNCSKKSTLKTEVKLAITGLVKTDIKEANNVKFVKPTIKRVHIKRSQPTVKISEKIVCVSDIRDSVVPNETQQVVQKKDLINDNKVSESSIGRANSILDSFFRKYKKSSGYKSLLLKDQT